MNTTPTTSADNDLANLLDAAGAGAKKRRIRIAIAIAAVLAAGIGAMVAFGGGPPPTVYEKNEAALADLEVTVTATGNLEGLNTVEVGAEVSGKVIEVLVDHNSRVEKGQLLARIDPEQSQATVDEATARVAAAEASVLQARASRDEAVAKRDRGEQQDKEGLIARQDLETVRAAASRAVAQLASARADLELARANLTSARSRLDKTSIVAPIGGVVLSRLVEPGQTVTAGFTTPVLFKVAEDLTRMRLVADVDESDVGVVREGQSARFTVDAWPERTFEAKVTSVRNEPTVEGTVVSYETLLSVDNAELLLRPGMTATATIVVDRRDQVLTVPNAALRFSPPVQAQPRGGLPMPGLGRPGGGGGARPQRAAGPRVWIEEAGALRPVPVKVLATDGMRSQIESKEIDAGTKVVTDIAEVSR